MSLIIAKQKACKAKGLAFYVTKNGIKNEGNLLGAKWEYKVIFTDKLEVYGKDGKLQKQPRRSNAKTNSSSKRERAEALTEK